MNEKRIKICNDIVTRRVRAGKYVIASRVSFRELNESTEATNWAKICLQESRKVSWTIKTNDVGYFFWHVANIVTKTRKLPRNCHKLSQNIFRTFKSLHPQGESELKTELLSSNRTEICRYPGHASPVSIVVSRLQNTDTLLFTKPKAFK